MGLLDSVIGSVTGSSQGSNQGSSSPTSPMVKALLLLLAAKAASSYMSGSSAGHDGTAPKPSGAPGGEPGTIQSGILKGLPSLDSLMERFTRSGHADKIQIMGRPRRKPAHSAGRTSGGARTRRAGPSPEGNRAAPRPAPEPTVQDAPAGRGQADPQRTPAHRAGKGSLVNERGRSGRQGRRLSRTVLGA